MGGRPWRADTAVGRYNLSVNRPCPRCSGGWPPWSGHSGPPLHHTVADGPVRWRAGTAVNCHVERPQRAAATSRRMGGRLWKADTAVGRYRVVDW